MSETPRPPEKPHKPKLFRRLRIMGAALATLVGVATDAIATGQDNQNSHPAGRVIQVAETPTPETGENQGFFAEGNSMVMTDEALIYAVDANGFPRQYMLEGQVFDFTEDQINLMRAAQAQAVNSGELQTVFSIDLPVHTPPSTYQPSPDRPFTAEIPPDVEMDPSQYGLEIIQGSEVELHFRQAAFEPGGLLYPLVQIQEIAANDNFTYKLRIVLVDGPRIATPYMTGPQYDGVRSLIEYLDEEHLEHRRTLMAENQVRIDTLRSAITIYWSQGDQVKVAEYERELAALVSETRRMEQLSLQELIEQYPAPISPAGLYVNSTFENGEGTSTIFVAVGESQPLPTAYWNAYYDRQGIFHLTQEHRSTSSSSFTPQSETSYPRLSDFPLNPNATQANGGYPYAARMHSPGQILRHELFHFHEDAEEILTGEPANRNEFDVDTGSMQSTENAHRLWDEQGDNTGYQAVFTIRPQDGGGYQLTGDRSTQRPPARNRA